MSVHPADHHPEQHEGRHPTFKQYVLIAIILFGITIIEFLIIVPKSFQGSAGVVAPLVILSAIKFAIVIMFYMHLKFDSRMFTVVFLAGLFLAFLVGSAAIGLFGSFTPTPREFAAANAVPFVHGEGEAPVAKPPAVVEPIPIPGTIAKTPAKPADPVVSPPASPATGDVSAGLELYVGTGGCAACHTIEGVQGAVGVIGPDHTHIGSEAANRIPGYSAEQYLRESILEPDAFIEEGYTPGLMAPLVAAANLSDADVDALVAFLLAQQ